MSAQQLILLCQQTLNLDIEPRVYRGELAGGEQPMQEDFPIKDIRPYLKELVVHVNYSDENGNTPLKAAARNGSSDTIRALIEAGASVEDPTLFEVAKNHPNSLETLLEYGMEIPEGYHFVDTQNEHCHEINEILLINGANVEAKDDNGLTLASRYVGCYPAMTLLAVMHGADVNSAHDEESLLTTVSSAENDDESSYALLQELASNDLATDMYFENKDHLTPIMLAAKYDNSRGVRFLLSDMVKLNPRRPNSQGETVFENWDEYSAEVQQAFIELVTSPTPSKILTLRMTSRVICLKSNSTSLTLDVRCNL